MPSALSLEQVVKDYPVPRGLRAALRAPFRRETRRALAGVDLEVPAGSVVGLLGPNGSGKTTCVKLLAGLVRPTEGRALVNGIDTAGETTRAQAGVGYVIADERSFYWRLDVRENLRFFAACHGLFGRDALRRIDELAQAVELGDLLPRAFRTLSSGQKARVAIARGLLHDPPAILLDEVTRTLDPGAAERLRHLVVDELCKKRKKGVLLTTHDLHEARSASDSIVLLVEGRVRARGTWDQVEPEVRRTFFEDAA